MPDIKKWLACEFTGIVKEKTVLKKSECWKHTVPCGKPDILSYSLNSNPSGFKNLTGLKHIN
jgi:uncharacterized protein YbaA (DUF1428 family)